MGNLIIIKNGLEAARTGVTPAIGELLWSTDETVLWAGNGATGGGIRVSTFGYDWTNETNDLLTTGNIRGSILRGNLNVVAGNDNLTTDDQFYLGTNGSVVPVINFDSGDTFEYLRSANEWQFYIASIQHLSLNASYLSIDSGTLRLKEQASANADLAAYGQLWVKTATPNELWFTDDAGTDTQIVPSSGGGGGITWVYKTSNYTAVAGDGILANISSGTITLPATLVVGDALIISNTHSTVLTIADAGHTIEYKGTSYTANISLAQGETVHLVAKTTAIMEIV